MTCSYYYTWNAFDNSACSSWFMLRKPSAMSVNSLDDSFDDICQFVIGSGDWTINQSKRTIRIGHVLLDYAAGTAVLTPDMFHKNIIVMRGV